MWTRKKVGVAMLGQRIDISILRTLGAKTKAWGGSWERCWDLGVMFRKCQMPKP